MKGGLNRKTTGWIFAATSVFVVIFLFLAPFHQGLFVGYEVTFERPLYVALVCSLVCLTFICFYLYRDWKIASHGDILVALIWIIPISYFIATLEAITSQWAFIEAFVRLGWGVFFVLGYYITRHSASYKILLFALIGSGYVIVMFGLLNWFGNAHYIDAVLADRLSSVFQYPNAYAAYLIAIAICALIMVQSSRKKRYLVFHAFMLVPVLLSLLLTLSRGALLVLFVVLIFYLALLPWKRQLISVMELGIVGIAAFAVYGFAVKTRGQLLENYSPGVSLRGWLLVLGIAAIASLIVLGVRLRFGRLDNNKADKLWSPRRLALPVVLVSLGLALYVLIMSNFPFSKILPAGIAARLEGVNLQSTSVFLRNTLYEDAIRAGADYPVFGAGGGAWSVLSESYKSYPYSSSKVHNFYIETYLESGLFGGIVLIAILCYVFVLLIGQIKKKIRETNDDNRWLIFPVFSIVILGHSFVDFDMSFFYLSSLVFLTLGATAAISNRPTAVIWGKGRVTKAFASGLFLVAIFMIYKCIVALRADEYYRSSINVLAETGKYDAVQSAIEQAESLRPGHPQYLVTMAKLNRLMYRDTKNESFSRTAEYALNKLKAIDPYNIEAVEINYDLDMDRMNLDRAHEEVRRAVELFPWTIGFYEKAIELDLRLGTDSTLSDDKRIGYLREARWLANEIIRRIEVIDRLPETERVMSRGVFGLNDNLQAQLQLLDAIEAIPIADNERLFMENKR
ncbi:O-antigen ligase family protein [Cohnella mopanensis]|uniref:O-antigen ligase family protein n=1 Tax=Cohnella mopanensis TaxID=2911966 RepID=UPI001EF8F4D3|nr:O-antigen ligase family protein [Cohnella mopanensis]